MSTWDAILLGWLNHLVAFDQQTFYVALFLSDRVPWVFSAVLLAGLWFVGAPDEAQPASGQLSRQESRSRVLLTVLSTVLAFIAARLLAYLAARPRPLVSFPLEAPIDPQVWEVIVNLLKGDGAFPSDYAAFWFALAAGVWTYNWKAGAAVAGVSLFFSALRVAVGYHWPSDMISGACLGVLMSLAVFWTRRRLTWLVNPTLQLFENVPVLAYPLGILLLFDMTQRMAWLFGLVATVFGIGIAR